MRKLVGIYGGSAGILVCVALFGSYLLLDKTAMFNEILGFSLMIPSLIVVVFGIKRFCDYQKPQVTRFTAGLSVGFSIVAVMSVIYAVGWEIFLFFSDYAYFEQYIVNELEKAKSQGVRPSELSFLEDEMRQGIKLYSNPFLRFGGTIMEIFPQGMMVVLLAVLLLRNPDLFKRTK